MDIASITAFTNILSQLKSMSDKVQEVQFKTLLVDLQNSAADVKLELVDLKIQNAQLLEKIGELTKRLNLKDELLQKDNKLYYKKAGFGGPYCSVCLEKDGKLISMHSADNGYTKCPSCDMGIWD